MKPAITQARLPFDDEPAFASRKPVKLPATAPWVEAMKAARERELARRQAEREEGQHAQA